MKKKLTGFCFGILILWSGMSAAPLLKDHVKEGLNLADDYSVSYVGGAEAVKDAVNNDDEAMALAKVGNKYYFFHYNKKSEREIAAVVELAKDCNMCSDNSCTVVFYDVKVSDTSVFMREYFKAGVNHEIMQMYRNGEKLKKSISGSDAPVHQGYILQSAWQDDNGKKNLLKKMYFLNYDDVDKKNYASDDLIDGNYKTVAVKIKDDSDETVNVFENASFETDLGMVRALICEKNITEAYILYYNSLKESHLSYIDKKEVGVKEPSSKEIADLAAKRAGEVNPKGGNNTSGSNKNSNSGSSSSSSGGSKSKDNSKDLAKCYDKNGNLVQYPYLRSVSANNIVSGQEGNFTTFIQNCIKLNEEIKKMPSNTDLNKVKQKYASFYKNAFSALALMAGNKKNRRSIFPKAPICVKALYGFEGELKKATEDYAKLVGWDKNIARNAASRAAAENAAQFNFSPSSNSKEFDVFDTAVEKAR